MINLIAKRIGASVVLLLLVSVAVFAATEILPGDVAQTVLGQSATPEAVAALRASMHLDQPAATRYFIWLGALMHGDLGNSLVNSLPVAQLIGERLPNSLMLAGIAALFCAPLGLSLGIASAIREHSGFDRAVNMFTLSVISVPEFLVGALAVLVFAVHLRWLPTLSLSPDLHTLRNAFRSFTLPVLGLSGIVIAQMLRMTRAALLDILHRPYIDQARLKGVGPAALVLRHALPNAIGPIASAMVLSLSHLLGGTIIIETVFNYPGLARLLVDAVSTRDMPLVQSCAMLFCVAYLFLVCIADVLGIAANPRLRLR
ncbi:ABC transporter permease [Caballeronia sp. AZ7_KS35]|uniref:ABC transporter permease n=1 Tax=Caballeronia sp. AZ7_KS35 TaxID=2921762 RepID=UPI002027A9FA|nr:ABC transporter permease [Caballeronia sp. AZ7_KS35]